MEKSFSEKKFTGLIQRTLLAGVFMSAFLILAGFAFTVSGFPAGAGVTRAGILALLLTPAARVVMLIYGYWRGGEGYFALASFIVLALLVISALV